VALRRLWTRDVEHDPMLIRCSPQPMIPARDADDDFIEMLLGSG
jgi:hypothetical protein